VKTFRLARKRCDATIGESVRVVRDFRALTQGKLATLTGIPQSTIAAIENDRMNLEVERTRGLGHALECHPAVLDFPG
jgi:DNA-binding XRE family transcriptional regulator